MMDLSQQMIDSGKILIADLDKRGEEVDAALWFLFTETSAWKLLISLPSASMAGPKEAYKTIQKSLSKLGNLGFGLDAIAVVRADSPLFKIMKTAIKTGDGISGIRFTNNVINGVSIEDAYIYRLE